MRRFVLLLISFSLVFSLSVPCFASSSVPSSAPSPAPSVKYGLYEDYFIFEGVSYSLSNLGGYSPFLLHLSGNTLVVVCESVPSSVFWLASPDGSASYYRLFSSSSSNFTLVYNYSVNEPLVFVNSGVITFYGFVLYDDISSVLSSIIVTRYPIYSSSLGDNVLLPAQPEVFYDYPPPIVVDPVYADPLFLVLFLGLLLLLSVSVCVR